MVQREQQYTVASTREKRDVRCAVVALPNLPVVAETLKRKLGVRLGNWKQFSHD